MYLRLGEFSAKDPDWDVGIENLLVAVTRVTTDSVTVSLPKDEVAALPAIPVHHWAD